jgi:hypothetical protein
MWSRFRGNGGFEFDLWRAAGVLRPNVDATEHKHAVLGLIFLKYIRSEHGSAHIPARSESRCRERPGAWSHAGCETRLPLRARFAG